MYLKCYVLEYGEWTCIICFSFRHILALTFRMRAERQTRLHASYAFFLSDFNPNCGVWTNFKPPSVCHIKGKSVQKLSGHFMRADGQVETDEAILLGAALACERH